MPECDNLHTMSNLPPTLSDILRDAITASGLRYKAMERDTGVARASIMRFVRGSQSLRLDMAERLAAYFGLTLIPTIKDKG